VRTCPDCKERCAQAWCGNCCRVLPRVCPDCGEQEQRRTDGAGRPLLNLDPVSGRCVKCLIAYAKAGFRVMPDLPADWAKKAAGDDD
jgi:hypothetical protein